MSRRRIEGREIIIEFYRVGDYVKVSAMDAEILTDASIVGSPKVTRAALERPALGKLDDVLDKRRSGPKTGR